jgi:hypothetical protein
VDLETGDPTGGASAANGQAAAPTLGELAEKLSKLREHLDQLVADLNEPSSAGVIANESSGVAVTCRECRRIGSTDDLGWTLRLCGDDELHAFCGACDSRYFNGNAR